MFDLKLKAVTTEAFSALPTISGMAVVVKLQGSCDLESTPLLDRFLNDLHSDLCRVSAPAVVIDFQELYFMNSASVKYFVTWLSKVRELEPPKRYAVRFLTNEKLTWQRRSLEAIRRFASDVVSIDH
jgi:hypothetical protein